MTVESKAPYTLRWGICATGWISTMFATDLLVDPATRTVSDVAHRITAVASRSADKAETWVKDTFKDKYTPGAVKCHGDYAALYADPDVDVVYIGTPHSHHYRNAHDALSAGKHVLCEKSLVVNGKQAQALADLAHSKGLFFMEAVWTRFQPITYAVEEVLASGVLGEVTAVRAELGLNWKGPNDHRMISPALAGGALCDVGPYSWHWLSLLLNPRASTDGVTALSVPKLASSMVHHPTTGVDISTITTLQFPQPSGKTVHGTMIAAFNSQTTKTNGVLVSCEKGFLEVHYFPQRPNWFRWKAWDTPEAYGDFMEKPPAKEEHRDFEVPGGALGFVYEADEVARCVRDGKTQSARMPLRESVLMMNTFDEIRRQGGLKYPDEIETLELA